MTLDNFLVKDIDVKEYLRTKGILAEDAEHWYVMFSNGDRIDLVEVMEEFKELITKQANEDEK